jgi:putative ABC transport system permease protein
VPLQIVGIVKDFNVQGLNMPVQPAMFNIGNFACGYRSGGAILVKIKTNNTQATLAAIEKAWLKVEPEFPIRYAFLNDNFRKLYAEYQRIQTVVGFFALVAVVISVIGLFAMSVFMVREKTKELGIRKILGADAKDIFRITSVKFLLQSTLGISIAIPLGWIAANAWLQDFAHRIQLSAWVFFIASSILILITLITVSFQSVKAIFSSPVNALRAE